MSEDADRYEPQVESYLEELDGAPRKPRCMAAKRLCVPVMMPGPSGLALRHDFTCPDKPGARISASEYVGQGQRRAGWRGIR
jgi:hypothetical protein